MNNNYYQQKDYEKIYFTNTNHKTESPIFNQYNHTTSLLKSRIGKNIKIYSSFPDSIDWRDKIFSGRLIGVGDDYTLINTNSNSEELILNIYINYIEFKE